MSPYFTGLFRWWQAAVWLKHWGPWLRPRGQALLQSFRYGTKWSALNPFEIRHFCYLRWSSPIWLFEQLSCLRGFGISGSSMIAAIHPQISRLEEFNSEKKSAAGEGKHYRVVKTLRIANTRASLSSTTEDIKYEQKKPWRCSTGGMEELAIYYFFGFENFKYVSLRSHWNMKVLHAMISSFERP